MKFVSVLSLALFSLVQGHSVILAAFGEAGSPSSVGFLVDSSIARNCSGISPCQQDTTIIRDVEISQNITGLCGRTEIEGNIDVNSNIENAISNNQVAQVQAGTTLTVTIHQVNQDGAGPYTCELFSNSSTTTGQRLAVTNDVPGFNGLSQAKFKAFNVTVQMPTSFTCTDGCFAVEQTD
ncbi:hypothetical protein SAPIO_CDS0626 [Scedosporium apiospermum]|uniref:Uncharacterized protein n=1 Tax=Pseudallescheria apiosperma TaxID=563466 RepID=A0A084GG64_PSEDA|nr:uncharacterized protein SAPIO_CDS0626 [Scedosporium apiospermum]KEZ46326.1 hypothetical protein SAPIO_CDS0626 [Scedosporium apiospermum]